MSILLDGKTKVLVQGITGKAGRAQTHWMLEYGTRVVAGVTPGRGGEDVEGVPVYSNVAEAVAAHGAEMSVFFVPPPGVKNAIMETVEAGIKLIVVVTEHMPVHDVMATRAFLKDRDVRVVGPTSPGIITPGEAKVGIMPGNVFQPGRIGIISRSGTLSYEISVDLSSAGLGQSTVVGVGGDPVTFTSMAELLAMFEQDPETDAIVLVGEVGGMQEENAARYIAGHVSKPVVAYIAGRRTPEGKRMGHAGAIIRGGLGTPQSKAAVLREAGVAVADYPCDVVGLLKKRLG